MTVYLDLVVILNFGVDFLLLIGTNRLCGYPMKPGKAAFAAALGGLYAGCCVLPGFSFLGNTLEAGEPCTDECPCFWVESGNTATISSVCSFKHGIGWNCLGDG